MNKHSINFLHATYLSAALITALFQTQGRPAPLDEAKNYEIWDVRIGLPLWAAGIDGKVGIDNRNADVDEDFWDIADYLDFAAALNLEVRYCGHWLFFANTIYTKTGTEVTPGGLISSVISEVELTQKYVNSDFGVGYNLFPKKRIRLEPFVGGRLTYLEAEIDVHVVSAPNPEFSRSRTWVDPIVGIMFQYPTDSWFSLFAEADIGGFGVNSDSTWQAQGGLQWDVTRHFYLRGSYRYLATDYDDDGLLYDVALSGPQLEFGFRF